MGTGEGGVSRGLAILFRDGTAAGLSDASLLRRFIERRDAHALAAIIHRHAATVWSVCARTLRNANDAEDAFQATFLVLVRSAGSIRNPDRLGGWLHGVACKVAARARRDARRRSSEDLNSEPVSGEAAPGATAERLEQAVLLHEELARLPRKYRDPIVLCHLEGCTHDEAADRLGWPLGTVRGRLARGREQLRDRLLRRGLDSPTTFGMLWSELAGYVPAAAFREATIPAVLAAGLEPGRALLLRAPVALWAEEILRMTMLSKWTTAAGALLAGALVLGSGAGVIALGMDQRGGRVIPASQKTVETPAPTPRPDPTPEKDEDPKDREIQRLRDQLIKLQDGARTLSEINRMMKDKEEELLREVHQLRSEQRQPTEVGDQHQKETARILEELPAKEAEAELLRSEVETLRRTFERLLQFTSIESLGGMGGGMGMRGPSGPEELQKIQREQDEQQKRWTGQREETRAEFMAKRTKLSRLETEIALAKGRLTELTRVEIAPTDIHRRLSQIEETLRELTRKGNATGK